MREYLVLRLYGPLASWGELAVGEQRTSASYPSRSALLGLIGASLGVRRDDDAGQVALSAGYRFGVKLLAAGMPLGDYHTVQFPDIPRKFSYRTRRQEVRDKGMLGTILTSREYRCDSLCTVAVVAGADAPHDLTALAGAIRQPVFVPFLGRKSCVLALPMDPRLGEFTTLKEALDSRDGENPWPHGDNPMRRLRLDARPRYYWDAGITDTGMEATLRQVRHDEPLSRRRWQFEPRQECVWLAGEKT